MMGIDVWRCFPLVLVLAASPVSLLVQYSDWNAPWRLAEGILSALIGMLITGTPSLWLSL